MCGTSFNWMLRYRFRINCPHSTWMYAERIHFFGYFIFYTEASNLVCVCFVFHLKCHIDNTSHIQLLQNLCIDLFLNQKTTLYVTLLKVYHLTGWRGAKKEFCGTS